MLLVAQTDSLCDQRSSAYLFRRGNIKDIKVDGNRIFLRSADVWGDFCLIVQSTDLTIAEDPTTIRSQALRLPKELPILAPMFQTSSVHYNSTKSKS